MSNQSLCSKHYIIEQMLENTEIYPLGFIIRMMLILMWKNFKIE